MRQLLPLLFLVVCTTDARWLHSKGNMRIPLSYKNSHSALMKDKHLMKMAAIKSNKVGTIANVTVKNEGIFIADITVGTPAQSFKVYVDTSNSYSFVASEQCTTEACKVHNRYNSNASSTYEKDGRPFDALVKGIWSKDKICISGICANNQSFGEVWLPSFYANQPEDGYLGLGWNNGSQSFVYSLVEQGVLSEPMVSIWINKNYHNSSVAGELILGGINTERFDESLTWVPALQRTGWAFTTNNISIGSTVPTCVAGCQAGLYMNMRKSLGPKNGTDALFNVLKPNVKLYVRGIFTWYQFTKCDAEAIAALPEISFNVNGKRLTLKGEEYVSLATECIMEFVGLESKDMDIWILGSNFMAKYYTVFDAEEKRIGFALANGY